VGIAFWNFFNFATKCYIDLSKYEINVDIVWNVTLLTRKKYTPTASLLQSCLTMAHEFVIINSLDESVKRPK